MKSYIEESNSLWESMKDAELLLFKHTYNDAVMSKRDKLHNKQTNLLDDWVTAEENGFSTGRIRRKLKLNEIKLNMLQLKE